MNKRASHVGIILSFVMFVTFLIFLYSILEPQLKVERDKEAFLEYLKGDLMKSFYGNLTVVIIGFPNVDMTGKTCSMILGVGTEVTNHLIVQDEEDVPRACVYGGGPGAALFIDSSGRFFKVFEAENFSPCAAGFDNSNCATVNPLDPGVNFFINKKEYIFESKVENIIIDYNAKGFDEVATELGLNIPPGSEFGLKFLDKDRTVLAETNEGELSVNIFSEEIPVQYVDDEANVEPGFIVLRVW